MRRWLAPRLLALHALAVAAVTVCTLMGFWQLGIYGSKHEDRAAETRTAQPADLTDVWGPDDAFSADLDRRQVWVRGTFTGEQFRVRRGPSDWIAAPIRVAGTTSSLIVIRGQGTAGVDAPRLPRGAVTFRAVLQPGEDGPADYDARSKTLQSVSVPALANIVDGDLFSGYALTDSSGINAGLTPVAPPDPHVSWTVGLRNLAYALQWWVFGMFAAFMWWRMVTDALEVEEALGEPAADAPVA